ncbi:MAG: Cof-type HAD-IIB family hydrolase [Lachnospiraceae bacterium]|nr:Cof-type HAD-IIB family hydrolase [Lachnospiraceae bacterium]
MDLDGTLLNDEKEISWGNQTAVDQALEEGHKMVIATGRSLSSALIQARRLGLTKDGCYVIAFNGGEIYDPFRNRSLYRRTIPRELVTQVFEDAHRRKIQIQTFADTEVLTEEDRPELHDYVMRTLQSFRIVPSVASVMEKDPCKILAIEEVRRDVIVQFRADLLEKYDGVLDCYFSNDSYLEIVPAGVTKGNAVRWMCDFLKIPIENSVAAGDAPNDIDMLEAAYVGAAMKNAYSGVKEHGDYVTKSDNNHDGVAEIINRFVLKRT